MVIFETLHEGARSRAELVAEAGYWLHLVRAIEETGRKLYLQGRLPGSFYDSYGQEATAVGVGLAMAPDDVATPLIRDMAVHLVRGVTASEMFRHYLGKAGGPMEGRDGNIHLGAFDRGTIPMISHLPEMLPVGMGVAEARRRRGIAAVAFGFCGDGASCAGVFHETLNLAAVWKAPLVLVVESNRYAYMTPAARYLPVEDLKLRAASYEIEYRSADGNNVIDVCEAAAAAADQCRAGGGPVLVEVSTYRMHGHGAHDGQKYVPAEELELWGGRDPLDRWRTIAADELGWSEPEQAALEQRVQGEVDVALEDALSAPYPSVDDLGSSVFA